MDPELPTPLEPAPQAGRPRGTLVDRRPQPLGGLPRQTQTWIMVGLALLILAVILVTGGQQSAPAGPTAPAARASTIDPARVRDYQARLSEQEARLQQELAAPPLMGTTPIEPDVVVPAPTDPLLDEQRRRNYQSLFAENVAFSRRSAAGAPSPQTPTSAATAPPFAWPMVPSVPDSLPGPDPTAQRAPAAATSPAATAPESSPEAPPGRISDPTASASAVASASGTQSSSLTWPSRSSQSGVTPASRHTLLEGTVIETVLMNRLDGTFRGPVHSLVTGPVYSQDRQRVVIPAGARVLGTAAPVQAWGESRLAVTFHRLVMPDGHAYALDSFTGLNQVGETGLRDQVDRHYLQVFGASLAIGAISGLAQFGTRGSIDASFPDAARQSAGASLATSTARVLDRYLNVLPTITIREGHRIKVVLTNDLALPAYADTDAAPLPPAPTGGTP